MKHLVYQITNLVNGKIYIGKHQTTDPNDNYMGSGKLLKRAISKYGVENFTKDILFVYDNEVEMNAKEAELVTEQFCSRKDTYNICPGGQGGFGFINSNGLNRNTSFSRRFVGAKIAQTLKGRKNTWLSEANKKAHREGRMNTSGLNHGLQHTDITRRKISETMRNKNKGRYNSQFGTIWITNGQQNKKIKKAVDIIPEGWYKGRKLSNERQS